MARTFDLTAFPLFSGLSPEDVRQLQQEVHIRHHAAGDTLFTESEPAIGFYLVVQGTVKIFKINPRGQEFVVAVIPAGQTFAEAAAFLGGKYPASTQCLEDCELIFVARDTLVRMIKAESDFALRMMAGMALKLRKFVATVEDLTLRDARGRLSRYLLGLVPPEATGPYVVTLPTQQNVLARLLGLTSETLSRTLKQLKEEGVVASPGGGRIELLKPERLHQSVDD